LPRNHRERSRRARLGATARRQQRRDAGRLSDTAP
jgi:hypothetical protein